MRVAGVNPLRVRAAYSRLSRRSIRTPVQTYDSAISVWQVWPSFGRTIVGGPTAYVLEADTRTYIDAIVRSQLMAFIERRIGDRTILRLIQKWIHVGAVADWRLLVTETGTGHGQVISPLLA